MDNILVLSSGKKYAAFTLGNQGVVDYFDSICISIFKINPFEQLLELLFNIDFYVKIDIIQ